MRKIIIPILTAMLLAACSASYPWPDKNDLNTMEDISAIEYVRYTKTGVLSGEITDESDIEDLVDLLKNAEIIAETKEGSSDGLYLGIVSPDKSASFTFEGDVLITDDGRYEVSGLEKVRNFVDARLTYSASDYNIAVTKTASQIKGNGFVLDAPDSWSILQTSPDSFDIFSNSDKIATIIAYDLDDTSYEYLPSFRIAGTGKMRFIAVIYADCGDLKKIGSVDSPFRIE